jgi:hypothetical protein
MALNLKMIKTDTLAVPVSNLEKQWDDRSCRKTGPVKFISGSVTVISSAPFAEATLLRERAVSCFSNHP